MTSASLRAIDRFARLRVLVLGEAMLDSYLVGSSTRLCQEAPVPVVDVRERWDRPGGAANTAMNLAALGCRVDLLSVVGDDDEGERVRLLLARHGVDTTLLAVQPGRQTLAKHRVMDGDRLLVRFDRGDTGPVGADMERRVADSLEAALRDADALVISDYGYGVVGAGVIARLCAIQARGPALVAIDARDLARHRTIRPTVVKPNYQEALRLAGEVARGNATHGEAPPGGTVHGDARSRAEIAVGLGASIFDRTGAGIVAITLDVDGAVVVERGRPAYRTHAEPADHARAAGAGDTYIAAFTLALAAGAPTFVAAEVAGAAAGVVVARDGTAACEIGALRAALGGAAGAPHVGPLDGQGYDAVLRPASGLGRDHAGEGADARESLGGRQAPALHQA